MSNSCFCRFGGLASLEGGVLQGARALSHCAGARTGPLACLSTGGALPQTIVVDMLPGRVTGRAPLVHPLSKEHVVPPEPMTSHLMFLAH